MDAIPKQQNTAGISSYSSPGRRRIEEVMRQKQLKTTTTTTKVLWSVERGLAATELLTSGPFETHHDYTEMMRMADKD